MRTDPLRVAAWCVVILAGLLFVMQTPREPPPPTTRGIESPPPPPVTPAAAYVANTNTHKFHRLSCRYATCKNCTATYATRDEALAAGYRPGGCCDP